MDHELRADSDPESENASSEQGLGTPNEHQTGDTGEAPGFEASTSDLASEASIDDNWGTRPVPPEWPAVDLGLSGADDDTETEATDSGDSADMLAVDDSDAPVELEDSETIRGENINLSQGGVKSIEATNVTFSQGGAGQVRAEQMSVEQSGVGLARVENLTLGSGASAFAVLADQATVEEGSNAFIVVTRSLSGDVRPTIDWRGAMAFGAGLGLALSILRRIR